MKPNGFDFNRREAAEYVGVSEATLRDWAHKKKNLPYAVVGKRAYYRKSDCDVFLRRALVRVA